MSLMTVSSASADDLTISQVLALLGGEVGVEHELGHADDAVHRRADLVAHVGQELALRAVGRLGGLLGGSQLRFSLLASVMSWEMPTPRTGLPSSKVKQPIPLSQRTPPSGWIARFWNEKSAPDCEASAIVCRTRVRSSGCTRWMNPSIVPSKVPGARPYWDSRISDHRKVPAT